MNHHTLKGLVAVALVASGIVAFASSVGAQGVGVRTFEDAKVPTPNRIERGAEIYANQCSGCHGADGKGRSDYVKDPFQNPVPDLTDNSYRYGGGPVQTYDVITMGLPGGAYHPTFPGALQFRERWAVTHYVRALGLYSGGAEAIRSNPHEAAVAAAEGPSDPASAVEEAKLRAEEGRCNPSVMDQIQKTIGSRLKPKGDEQLQKGKKLYDGKGTCYTCHGEDGRVLDSMEGQDIPPRNFRTTDAAWQDGPNALAIYNTITNGARGQMRSFKDSLSVDERWAITHFLLEKWIPGEIQSEVGEQQLRSLCRQRSAGEPPRPMWKWEQFTSKSRPPDAAVKHAMDLLVKEQQKQRYIELRQYGSIQLAPGADADRGREIYADQCRQCHGAGGQGRTLGPFGVERAPERNLANPRLQIRVRALHPAHAGGTFRDFARRASSGVHATLPEMSAAALLDAEDWQDLQAFVASVEGKGQLGTIPVQKEEAKPPQAPAPDAGTGDAGTGARETPGGGSTAPATSADAGTTAPDATTEEHDSE